ncbi:MAG: glycoside hydrolase family 5 protein [Roseibium sp.]|nr:glycoside hydrolase family 5 protein [Roseibium sp.]
MRIGKRVQETLVNHVGRKLSAAGTILLMLSLGSAAGAQEVCYKGVNLSGAEYGDKHGILGTNYIYPTEETVSYFAEKGMNLVRLPFRWERLQPVFGEALNTEELNRLHNAVELIRSHGMKVLLDPHNFGYYDGKRLMTADVPAQAFANFWIRLAQEFANQEDIMFGLMNEPYDIPVEDWLIAANQAIAGIRAVGAENLILVPGTNWSGASSWQSDRPAGNNGNVMSGVSDPADNFIYEVHQYMDEDFSGTHETCPQADLALKGLVDFTGWLKEQGARGLLGEFGGSKDPACLAGLTRMVDYMDEASEQWLGWTYWAAGDWWPATEGNNIQPVEGTDRPQLAAVMQSKPQVGSSHCSTLN